MAIKRLWTYIGMDPIWDFSSFRFFLCFVCIDPTASMDGRNGGSLALSRLFLLPLFSGRGRLVFLGGSLGPPLGSWLFWLLAVWRFWSVLLVAPRFAPFHY